MSHARTGRTGVFILPYPLQKYQLAFSLICNRIAYFYLCCLFVRDFSSHWRIFHYYGVVTMKGVLRFVLGHSCPLNYEGSLACHAYCDSGHPTLWSSPRTHDTHTYYQVFNQFYSQSTIRFLTSFIKPEPKQDDHTICKLYKNTIFWLS